MKYLEYGLRHNSWDLKYQLDYAKLLKEKGNLKESERRAEIIVTYAENDNLINEACEILKRPKLPSIPTRKALDDKENTIIFVPIGEVDAWLLFDLQKKLKEILKVKVEIQDFNIPAPKYSRDRRDMTIQDIRENLTEQSDSSDIAQLLKEMGISKNDLKDDQIVIKAARKISEMMGGKKAVNSFNQKLEDAIGKDCQWDIDELYSRLVNETEKDKKTKFKFLGICNLDTYTKGANFLFGTASDKGYGVISYKRFSAEFNEEPPNRARLLDRTLKQALSSLGYMYGIERCSIPTCPRTYPNNLKEHDAKGTELCSKCKQAFEEALK
jgi:predicted Zn-dependent protease